MKIRDFERKTAEEIDAEAVAHMMNSESVEVDPQVKAAFVEKMFADAKARNDKRKRQATVFMHLDFKDAVMKIARSEGVTLSDLIRRVLIIQYPETLGMFEDPRKWRAKKN